MKLFSLKPVTLHVLQALSIMCVAAPFAVYAQQATDLGTVSASGNGSSSGDVPAAAKAAVSQGSLDARSAQSVVSDDYVRNYMSPVADFSQVFELTPGAFSYSPNGVGQGNAGTTIRGLSDSQYLVTFDGIPFNDTNGVSHHSYVFFPAQEVGGAVIDRSPGSASTIGQATFGGSLNLLSRKLDTDEHTSITGSYGSWDTRFVNVEQETGQFGANGNQNLLLDAQNMKSDGYQTDNFQWREAYSAKYQNIVSPSTVVTIFSAYQDVRNNQANATATLGQIRQYGDNFLNSNDPTSPTYFGYNFYDVRTSFSYVGVVSDLGNGWKLDDKVYNYGYHNKQNYPGASVPVDVAATGTTAAIPATANDKTNDSGVDKLNSYHTFGNLLRMSDETNTGTLRTGLWTEYANSYRYQTPTNPLTWIDGPTPNFSETYQTITVQPYVEYEYKVTQALNVTAGLKYANYEQDFDHLADLKKVGPLGGTINKTTNVITGGEGSVENSITYRDFLPSLDAHYLIEKNWSAYAQFAAGDLIPPTSVFDVANAQTTTVPKAQKSKTVQIGTVFKAEGYTLDFDAYHVRLDNSYNCIPDPANPADGDTVCFAAGTEITQGVEAESTILLGAGFSFYVNGTLGTTKYSTGNWVAGAPGNTETAGVFYKTGGWDASIYTKRVGKMYNDGAVSGSDSYVIDPVVLTNMFVNYTIKNPSSFAKQAKVQLAVNNLFNQHSITSISGSGVDANPSGSTAGLLNADTVNLLPGRGASLTLTVDF